MVAAVLLHVGYLLLRPCRVRAAPPGRPPGCRLAHIGIVFAVLGAGESGILVIDFYNLAISRAIGAPQAVALGTHQQDVLSGIAVIALPSTVGMALGAILLAFAIWRARVVALWVPLLTTAGMLGLTLLAATFVPAVVACLLVTAGLLAQAWALARTPDAVYATVAPADRPVPVPVQPPALRWRGRTVGARVGPRREPDDRQLLRPLPHARRPGDQFERDYFGTHVPMIEKVPGLVENRVHRVTSASSWASPPTTWSPSWCSSRARP